MYILTRMTFLFQIYYDRILKLIRVDYVTDSLPPYNTETTATEIHDFNTGKQLHFKLQTDSTELLYVLRLTQKSSTKSM